MKMTKKILLGAAALFATVAFVSCGGAAEEDGIMKVGETVQVDITNSSDSLGEKYTGGTYRTTLPTKLKHAGGLVKVSFDTEASTDDPGIIGFIFDLKKNSTNKSADDFFVIGLRISKDSSRDSMYYVSKYSNVTDYNEENFGANDKGGQAVEKPLNSANGALSKLSSTIPTEDGLRVAYIYVIANDDGSFSWKILNDKATEKTKKLSDKEFKNLDFTGMVLAEGEIPASETGYTKQTQGKLSAYAGVYNDQTLKGEVAYIGTFKEADFVEE